jgi:hypothetical protein
VTGLHQPQQRPSANDWETALVKTVDLIQPCLNTDCSQKWYVFDNTHNLYVLSVVLNLKGNYLF